MKSKRGQGLPMNTIVIAAIVLVVLVVLIMIFTGRIALFNQGVQDCNNKGGKCVSQLECDINQGRLPITGGKCDNVGDICCSAELE